MSEVIDIECTHIEDELMRVRFANTQIVSDHPKEWGGTDTGPAPGDMVLMALVSATALAGRRFANEKGLDVGHVGARASMTSLQEGLPEELSHVPLPFLTYAERFWRLLEIDGCLAETERDAMIAAMTDNGVARAIRDGIDIQERVVFRKPPPGQRRAPGGGPGNSLLKGRTALPAGEKRVGANADNWRIAAAALDDQTCLVRTTGSLYVASDASASHRAVTPEELLLGGLGACTCIYVARNAQFQDIRFDSIVVRVRAEQPGDPDQPITRVEKVAEITGEFSEEEMAKLESLAQFCAFGVTLGRGTNIEDSLAIREEQRANAAFPGLASLDRPAPAPNDPAYCTDGSCCVPVFEQRAP